MDDVAPWIVGALMGVVVLAGILMASRAVDGAFALFGWLLAVFGLAVIIRLVARGTAAGSSHQP